MVSRGNTLLVNPTLIRGTAGLGEFEGGPGGAAVAGDTLDQKAAADETTPPRPPRAERISYLDGPYFPSGCRRASPRSEAAGYTIIRRNESTHVQP